MAKSGCRRRVEVELCAASAWEYRCFIRCTTWNLSRAELLYSIHLCHVPDLKYVKSQGSRLSGQLKYKKQRDWLKLGHFHGCSPEPRYGKRGKVWANKSERSIREATYGVHYIIRPHYLSLSVTSCPCPCLREKSKRKTPVRPATMHAESSLHQMLYENS